MTPPNLGGQNLVEDGASRSLYQTYRGTLNQLKIPRAPTHPNTLSQVLDKANGFLKAILQALPQVFPRSRDTSLLPEHSRTLQNLLDAVLTLSGHTYVRWT